MCMFMFMYMYMKKIASVCVGPTPADRRGQSDVIQLGRVLDGRAAQDPFEEDDRRCRAARVAVLGPLWHAVRDRDLRRFEKVFLSGNVEKAFGLRVAASQLLVRALGCAACGQLNLPR